MPKQPLAEVFGYPIDNFSSEAVRHRTNRLCPFNNRVPNCTKDKANDPLGVCSVFDADRVTITCPIRFRQKWLIADDAAGFFFPPDSRWTSLTEVRLNDANGKSAGNIDVVLVSYNDMGKITDFGALEVQAVYISGNIRKPFERYMQQTDDAAYIHWPGAEYHPRPDYLSSSRKRLAPQLIFKGGILNEWEKKIAVAVDINFFGTLPEFPICSPEDAELAWLIYDLKLDSETNQYQLTHVKTVFSRFAPALDSITRTKAGSLEGFMKSLQDRFNARSDQTYAPDAPILTEFFEEDGD
jgi:hypothetical protein